MNRAPPQERRGVRRLEPADPWQPVLWARTVLLLALAAATVLAILPALLQLAARSSP